MIQRDVCIVGAGPAGLTTALFLAKNGIKSTVVEKATFPRDKICGDAFSGKVSWVLRKLDLDFEAEIHKEKFQLASWGVKFFGTKNNELKVPFKLNYDAQTDKAPGFIASRLDFDNYLFEKAKANDLIEIIENTNLTNFARNKNGVLASTKDNSFQIESKIIVGANGAYSKLAKELLGLEVKDDSNSLGLRTYYKNVKNLDQEGYIELHFLEDLLPGYFWIFPMKNGMANVGAGIRTDLMRKNKINLKKAFQKILDSHPEISKRFEGAELVDDIKLFGLPLGSQKRKLSSDNVILLGDAAALIDPFTGEGIGNAMISGMLAAENIEICIKENDFSESKLISYDEKIYKRLGKELQLSKQMQELSRFPWLFNFVVNKARKNKELQEVISCMFESVDVRKKLSNPMFYLRILFS
ncbi:MAG: NAD(P)/FAD-dependent oxidoreductase [Chitinophagales bacterium]